MKILDVDLYQDVFTGTSAAFAVIDGQHGAVVATNEATARLLGHDDPADLVGKAALDLFPADTRERAQDILDDHWNGEGPDQNLHHLLTLGGDPTPVWFTSHVVVRDELAYLVLHVIDARRQLAAEALATQDIVCQNRFITNLAGELRLPCRSLAALAGVLTGLDLEAKPKAVADLIAASGNGLRSLVDDLHELAQITAEQAGKCENVFHLETMLQGIADTFAPMLRERELSYSLTIDRKLPVWLVGDAGRLRQVLVNLISNALNFTDDGGLTVEVAGESYQGDQVTLRCNVIDSGSGIPANKLGAVFDEGAGTGLLVTHQLVESMGGELVAESREDWGSNFSFTVKLRAAENDRDKPRSDVLVQQAQAEASLRTSSLVPKVTGLRVLLAEDSKVNQVVALGMLRKLGFECAAADNGLRAIEMLREASYDLVFMDLQMPELGGLQATRQIRVGAAGEENCDIPIVALTGQASYKDRQICLDAGMQGYVVKPFNAIRLKEAVDKLSSPREETGAPFSMTELVSQMHGDFDLAAEVRETYLADARDRLHRSEQALAKHEYGVLGEQALALEEAAEHMCARIMMKLAQELRRTALHREQEYAESLLGEMVEQLERISGVSD